MNTEQFLNLIVNYPRNLKHDFIYSPTWLKGNKVTVLIFTYTLIRLKNGYAVTASMQYKAKLLKANLIKVLE